MYPAIKKNKCQEQTVDILNDVQGDMEDAKSVTIDLGNPEEEETRNAMEMHEVSKAAEGLREVETSSNGPTSPVLTEIV